jgi:geranylgeranyl diphosphate synthase, type II
MSTLTQIPALFLETKTQFEKLLLKKIASFGEKTPLRDACEYALMNGGKRIRPLIVYMVAEALDQKKDVSEAALSIEYFHTASLIVDDLPCMDDDDFRRDKPTVHKVFGEATAILSSYALMTAGFENIYISAQEIENAAGQVCLTALYEVSKASGIHGATGGQYLDLYILKPSLKELITVIEKKTVTLFEIAFLYGWIFGGGSLNKVKEIKTLGYHFGMAFQIADDLRDFLQDQKRSHSTNIVLHLGIESAKSRFQEELKQFSALLDLFNIHTQMLSFLVTKLKEHAEGK